MLLRGLKTDAVECMRVHYARISLQTRFREKRDKIVISKYANAEMTGVCVCFFFFVLSCCGHDMGCAFFYLSHKSAQRLWFGSLRFVVLYRCDWHSNHQTTSDSAP